MTIVPIQLPPGIIKGANPDDAPGRWYDGNLVRWRDSIMEPVGGWERSTKTPLETPIRKIHQWRDNMNGLHILVGTDYVLRDSDSGRWTDITPTGFVDFTSSGVGGVGYGASYYGNGAYGVPNTGPSQLQEKTHAWSFANWGEDVLIVASSDGRLLYHDTSAPLGRVTAVTGAPLNNRAVIVTPERHAMLLQVGGDVRTIGWSSRENYADWNFSSTTNTAGSLPLRAETPLIAGTVAREGVLIWSETEAFLVRYQGLPYIYGADELGSSNLYAPNAFADFDGKCAWMDRAGFMLYQGGSIATLPCPLVDYVFSNINKEFGPRMTHAVNLGSFNEIWWFYPSSTSEECDSYVAWNYVDNWWSLGKLARSAAYPAGAGPHPLMGGVNGHIYQHEVGWTYDGYDVAGNIFVSSGTLNIGAGEQAMHISQLIPANGSTPDATAYTLFTRMTPGSSEIQNGPYYARADGYVDTRAMGRDVRLRISANKATDWSIGRIRMDVSAGGRR